MSKLVENLPSIFTLVGLVISAVWGPSVVAKVQGKIRISEVKTEGDASTEQMYITNMGLLLTEYKEQVSGFKEELQEVRKEFSAFRQQQEKKTLEYESKINFLEIQIEDKNDKIDELEVAINEYEITIIEKDTLILELKGDM